FALHAMLKMTRTIMAASAAQVENNDKAIKLYGEAGWTTFFVDSESEEFKCQLEGQPAYNVTDGNVWDVVFNVLDNRVQIDLRGSDGNLQTHFVKTIMMRNYAK
ncbi:unnamed protein product, partial [marine sediment metagenome]